MRKKKTPAPVKEPVADEPMADGPATVDQNDPRWEVGIHFGCPICQAPSTQPCGQDENVAWIHEARVAHVDESEVDHGIDWR